MRLAEQIICRKIIDMQCIFITSQEILFTSLTYGYFLPGRFLLCPHKLQDCIAIKFWVYLLCLPTYSQNFSKSLSVNILFPVGQPFPYNTPAVCDIIKPVLKILYGTHIYIIYPERKSSIYWFLRSNNILATRTELYKIILLKIFCLFYHFPVKNYIFYWK